MSIQCPCGGGRAYSRDEMIAFDLDRRSIQRDGAPTSNDRRVIIGSWQQVLGPDDFYCPHEDDVLLASEVEAARGT